MTKHLLRIAAAGAAMIALHAPARAQAPAPVAARDSLPAPLPWGIDGAAVSAALQAKELDVVIMRAGRDVHASSSNRHLQAVAILRSDSLVGLIYFHPENAALNASDLFRQAASRAEATHGPPFCRKSDLAVWTLDSMRLEVRLRRSVGDGAPGAEIRYIGPGYADEMARRTTARRGTPRPASTGRASGPRLLGSPVPPPAGAEPVPATLAPAADACVAGA